MHFSTTFLFLVALYLLSKVSSLYLLLIFYYANPLIFSKHFYYVLLLYCSSALTFMYLATRLFMTYYRHLCMATLSSCTTLLGIIPTSGRTSLFMAQKARGRSFRLWCFAALISIFASLLSHSEASFQWWKRSLRFIRDILASVNTTWRAC